MSNSPSTNSTSIERGVWSPQEHDKFLQALKIYPDGPWRAIADFVGSRSARQVQTHAQKYYEKVARRVRGLRKDRKRVVRAEHRLDDDMATLCRDVEGDEDAVVTVLALNTRRGIQKIAMSRCGASPPSTSSTSSPERLAIKVTEVGVKMETMLLNDANDGGESDSSLSSLDDGDLSYLLKILESRDYEVEDKSMYSGAHWVCISQ